MSVILISKVGHHGAAKLLYLETARAKTRGMDCKRRIIDMGHPKQEAVDILGGCWRKILLHKRLWRRHSISWEHNLGWVRNMPVDTELGEERWRSRLGY